MRCRYGIITWGSKDLPINNFIRTRHTLSGKGGIPWTRRDSPIGAPAKFARRLPGADRFADGEEASHPISLPTCAGGIGVQTQRRVARKETFVTPHQDPVESRHRSTSRFFGETSFMYRVRQKETLYSLDAILSFRRYSEDSPKIFLATPL